MSNATPPRTVWLLGAGFSKPLGGPLFTEVLSEAYMRSATAWVAAQLNDHRDAVHGMQLAARFHGAWLGEQWRDAEDFLDVLERAKNDAGTKLLVQQLLRLTLVAWNRDQMPVAIDDDSKTFFAEENLSEASLDVDDLRKRSQQLVAATTSAFLASVAPSDERVELYERWFSRLTVRDTIVSLNYDRVVENLASATGNTAPKIVKLHGTVPQTDELLTRIAGNESVPEIGLPGPQKRTVARDEWASVAATLRAAERFVTIGYSFPQTDVSVAGLVARALVSCSEAWVVAGSNGGPIVDLLKVVVPKPRDTGELCERFLLKLTRRDAHLIFPGPG